MAAIVTNTTQLSTFSIVKGILLANSILSPKFTGSIYEFEQRHKGSKFKGFPYIIVRVPENPVEDGYLGNTHEGRNFNIEISLVMDFSANDKYTGFANAIINALNAGEATFKESGYDYITCSANGSPVPITEDQLPLLIGDFILVLNGDVAI